MAVSFHAMQFFCAICLVNHLRGNLSSNIKTDSPPSSASKPLRSYPQGVFHYSSSQWAAKATAPKPTIMMPQFSRMVLPDWTCPEAIGDWWLRGEGPLDFGVRPPGGIRLAAGLLSWKLMSRLSLVQGSCPGGKPCGQSLRPSPGSPRRVRTIQRHQVPRAAATRFHSPSFPGSPMRSHVPEYGKRRVQM